VIELDAQPPPKREDLADRDGVIDEERLQQEFERHKLEKVVRVRDDDHLALRDTWRGGVEEARTRSTGAAQRGLDLLVDALNGRRCLAEFYADAYALPPRAGEIPRAGAFVSPSCGGCPACRSSRRGPYPGAMPCPFPPWPAQTIPWPADVTRLLGPSSEAFLFDEHLAGASGADKMRRERFLRFLIVQGFRTIVAPAHRLAAIRSLFSGPDAPPVFFAEEWEPLSLPPTPAIVIDPSDRACLALFAAPAQGGGSPRLIWLAAERRDPQKPHCLLRHTVSSAAYRFEEFCTKAGI
jgi:hypothetical protein